MSASYLIAAARTPIGKFLGGLSTIPAPELASGVLKSCLERTSLAPEAVDEVILGHVLSAGCGMAPARQAALKAGLPDTISAWSVNKMCGSGLQAVMLADQAIRAGDAQAILAGGMESMSRSPHLLRNSRQGWKAGPGQLDDGMIHDGLWCSLENCHMGELAEGTASRSQVSRQDQDEWAVESQRRAVAAQLAGSFTAEIVPVVMSTKAGTKIISDDEGPRAETTLASLSQLKPSFQTGGTVTAGNASTLNDGAAAVLVVSEDVAQRQTAHSGAARFRIVASYTSGVAARDIFIAPISAVQGVLRKAKLQLAEIDLIELNEAFASQAVACVRGLGADPAKVNVHGGALALGHPIGASGARVLVTLLSALEQRGGRLGLASLCLGGGNAVAMIVERV